VYTARLSAKVNKPLSQVEPRQPKHGHAVMAGFLGWTLDAFDYFVVIFMFDTLAAHFHVSKADVVRTTVYTLALRPVGALLFGLLADRYGRRKPLMANVIFFSIVEFLCGFAPNFTVFVVLRALYGIGMGGEWGVGASLAMESSPNRWRGVLSGVLQSGYSVGYLLAALAARFVLPAWGWRAMFWVGGLPALLAFYIRLRVPESQAWKQHQAEDFRAIMRLVSKHKATLAYMVLLMTLMMFLSHGTQDLYPDFLKTQHGVSQATVSYIAILYNIGAIIGGIAFGQLSQSLGRRYTMIAALILALMMIPAWAFGSSLLILATGAFALQIGVQGAWGIIPVHLNELSPDSIRGVVPGFAYQLGILFAAGTNAIEFGLRNRAGYSWALASFEIITICSLIVVLLFGSEQKGKAFGRHESLSTAT
jgi:MFS transporter, SHS family, lactate transporter